MPFNILLLETITEEALHILAQNAQVLPATTPFSGLEIATQHPIHAIVTRGKGAVNEALINACNQLQVIARCGVGLDNVNVELATQKGIKVVNAPGSNADTVAEHALGLMLMLQRHLYTSIEAVKQNDWNFRNRYQGDEIRGKTLGILGLGNIGSKVAHLAAAFGMHIIYWDIHPKNDVPYTCYPLEDLLEKADIISLHLPLVSATRQLLDANLLHKMKPNSLIVNTSRGEVIDQIALLAALEQNKIGGFAADVLDQEPPAANDPLLQLPNVLITPHSASLTARTYNEMCVITAQNTVNLLTGKTIDEKFIFNRNQL